MYNVRTIKRLVYNVRTIKRLVYNVHTIQVYQQCFVNTIKVNQKCVQECIREFMYTKNIPGMYAEENEFRVKVCLGIQL